MREQPGRAIGGQQVGIGGVESELLRLWDEAADPGVTLSRTVVLTLLAVSDGRESAESAAQAALAIAVEHPSRAIIVTNTAGGSGEVSAHVSVACRLVSHTDKQLCSEQVRIDSNGAGLGPVISAALPLAVSDLPLAVWFPDGLPEGDEQISRLTHAADRLIVDSRKLGADRIAWLAEISRQSVPVVADLAWLGLSAVRLAIARVFDSQLRRDLLPDVSRIEIVHGESPGADVEALLLAGWISSRLQWSGLGFAVKSGDGISFGAASGRSLAIRTSPGTSVGIESISLIAGADLRFRVALSESGELSVEVKTPVETDSWSYAAESLSPNQALCGALEVIRPDMVYCEALDSAAALHRAANPSTSSG